VGEEHVVPTTRFRDNRDSWAGRPRIGDRASRWRNGEFDGVNFSRLDGVVAILIPFAVMKMRCLG
jgi:hypothetical protein